MKLLSPRSLACAVALSASAAPASQALAQDSLQACAAIAAADARLACYDHLAHAAAARTGTPPAAGATGGAPASAASAPPASGTRPPKESFGLYAAEHPAPPPAADALQAKVQAFGRNANGRPTVALAGEGLWELDESDPLLAVGDTVTIKRATLGSFILMTPGKRTHRVRRLN